MTPAASSSRRSVLTAMRLRFPSALILLGFAVPAQAHYFRLRDPMSVGPNCKLYRVVWDSGRVFGVNL